ncbi:hypothetical protein PHMEG_0004413 [Phytophthora megakarya]|uniref:PLD phosphodiesterase domain-containing protein n=1 Tax=Phytophthora megakarya TaxID=4795 RepID=A0A225WVH5_9STRA|nr:hypothetical protein PHMEG_0004413 [Phytophthora megakarya]
MAVGPFEYPVLKSLLEKGAEIWAQKSGKTQHQKMLIPDDIVVMSGSANPSKAGLENSFESLTYHFDAEESTFGFHSYQCLLTMNMCS